MSFRDRFARFMYGRYGVDQLSKFMMALVFVLCVLSFFISGRLGSMISTLIFISIIFIYFRMFSKNIYKRAAENEKYMQFSNKFKRIFQKNKKMAGERKYYKFYSCPRCKQTIRIPKGRGKIEITCPKCHTKFIRKS